jgi:hypothetical protein
MLFAASLQHQNCSSFAWHAPRQEYGRAGGALSMAALGVRRRVPKKALATSPDTERVETA